MNIFLLTLLRGFPLYKRSFTLWRVNVMFQYGALCILANIYIKIILHYGLTINHQSGWLRCQMQMARRGDGLIPCRISTSKLSQNQIQTHQFTRSNEVHSNHIFVTTMRLVSKPTYFMTSSVLIIHVHVVTTCYNYIYAITRKVEPNSNRRFDYNL